MQEKRIDSNLSQEDTKESKITNTIPAIKLCDKKSEIEKELCISDFTGNHTLSEAKFNGVEIAKLSKRQLKKYKKCLKWQEVKKEKRAKQRLKNKEKKKQARLNNIDLGPSRKVLKRAKMANSPCKIGICIDLSFDHLMIDKDLSKTIKQILRIYTENRRAKAPMQLYLCDFNGRSLQEMAKHHGYEHWDINFHSENYLDLFPKEKLVYLTSESDNVLTELKPDRIYIIGGLVDHNSQKGICYRKAVEQGIKHAQLPINEYFQIKRRKVLTINQVFEILLKVSEGKTFKEALEVVIPKRVNMLPSDKNCEPSKEQLTCDEKGDVPVQSNRKVNEDGNANEL